MTRFLPRTSTRVLLVAGAVLPVLSSASAQDIKTMHGKIMGEAHIQMSATDKEIMASMSEKMLLMKMMRMGKI